MAEYRITLEKFQGPLDVLLQLIEKKELDITHISLSAVTEQFLDYLEKVEEKYPEELADFLVVATKLLLIKSRQLLPAPEAEEEDDTLARQLRMFQAFQEASKQVEHILRKGEMLFSRPPSKIPATVAFQPPEGMTKTRLHELFVEVLAELEPIIKIPRAAIEKAVTVKEKIMQIQRMLKERRTINFTELLKLTTQTRTDVVITFLAMLELVKQKNIAVRQREMFEEIIIEKT